jgi:hypothetical protein
VNIEWVNDQSGHYFAYVDRRCVASITQGERGWWAQFNHAIYTHLNPTSAICKTEAGIKRRVEKYTTLWVIAGRPE